MKKLLLIFTGISFGQNATLSGTNTGDNSLYENKISRTIISGQSNSATILPNQSLSFVSDSNNYVTV